MPYIDFSNDGLKARTNPHKETIDFWTNLEQKARQLSTISDTIRREEL